MNALYNFSPVRGFCLSLVLSLYPFVVGDSLVSGQVLTNISPDSSLGTVVTASGPIHDVTGGTRPGGGANLFHSFDQFTVGFGETANFFNESAIQTNNILSRVTGGNPSNIFGTIQTTGFGQANLFLLNPAGVVFGPLASLDVGGSFFVSSADFLRLEDNEEFYTDLSQNSILTISPPEAFGFLSATPGLIEVQPGFLPLTVPPDQTLSLVGGPVLVTNRSLVSRGGEIRISSIAQGAIGAEVSVATGDPTSGSQLGAITLQGETTLLDTSALPGTEDVIIPLPPPLPPIIIPGSPGIPADGRGGAVIIRGGQLVVDAAQVNTQTVSFFDGDMRGIDFAVDSLDLLNGAQLLSSTSPASTGSGSPIEIIAGQSILLTGENSLGLTSSISTSSSGSGATGSITLTSPEITIDRGTVGTDAVSLGLGAPIVLNTNRLDIKNGGEVRTQTSTGSEAGSISIRGMNGIDSFTNEVFVEGEGIVGGSTRRSGIRSRSTGGVGKLGDISISGNIGRITDGARIGGETLNAGQAGTITVVLNESLDILGKDAAGNPSGIFSFSTSGVQSGDIIVSTGTLTLADEGIIRSQSTGDGQGGNLIVSATNSMNLSEEAEISSVAFNKNIGDVQITTPQLNIDSSIVSTATEGAGDAGDLTIMSNVLNLTNGAEITSNTSDSGKGGDLVLASQESISLFSNSSISASSSGTDSTAGNSGNISLSTEGTFTNDASSVSTSAQQAEGGDITIVAGENVDLLNQSLISAETKGSNNAGDIQLESGDSILMNDSRITTVAEQADGGNIKLTAPELIHLIDSQITSSVGGGASTVGGNINLDPEFIILQNSQILANAFEGLGGNITLTGNVILIDSLSRLDASSALGINGSVNIQAPIQNLSGTIAPLQHAPVNVANLYSSRCVASKTGKFSSFVDSKTGLLSDPPGGFLESPLIFSGPVHNETITNEDIHYLYKSRAKNQGPDRVALVTHSVIEEPFIHCP